MQIRSTSPSISELLWSSFVSHTSTIFDFSNTFTSMVHHSFTLSFGIIYLHYSFTRLLFICSFICYFSLRRLPYLPDHSLYPAFFSKKDACFFEIPKGRRLCLLHSKCRRIGGHCPSDVEWRAQMTPAFSCKPKRGTGSPVSAAGVMPTAMLAGLADRLPHRRFVRFFSL